MPITNKTNSSRSNRGSKISRGSIHQNKNRNSANTSNDSADASSFLIQLYLKLNQATYAIVAFPIGTVLSIGPIFLYREQGIGIRVIGLVMGLGELIGIGLMKLSEASTEGFLFKRPYDLYFINVALALSLILIPVWSQDLAFLSCMFMTSVQAFNSASKPVVSESIHRLAVMMDSEPNVVFAQANTLRRIGNATIGLVTPLLYSVEPFASFPLVGGIMLLFLIAVATVDTKIKKTFDQHRLENPESKDFDFVNDSQHDYRKSPIRSMLPLSGSLHSNGTTDSRPSLGDRRSQFSKEYSTISRLKSYRRRCTNSIQSNIGIGGEFFVDFDDDGNDDESDENNAGNSNTSGFTSVLSAEFSGMSSATRCSATRRRSYLLSVDEGGEEDCEEDSGDLTTEQISGLFQHHSEKLNGMLSNVKDQTQFTSIEECDDESSQSERDASKDKIVQFGSIRQDTSVVEHASPNSSDDGLDSYEKKMLQANSDKMTDASSPAESSDDSCQTEDIVVTARSAPQKEEERLFASPYAYFLIIYMFPFWDAVISRLPFSFLTIAIVDQYKSEWDGSMDTIDLVKAGCILFGYQIGRAVSQSIQVWKCNTAINYILNSIALVAYIVTVIYVFLVPNGLYWFVPLIFTGFAETLPIQQLFMLRLFPEDHDSSDEGEEEENMELRNAVKASHTFTGIGSMVAFLSGSFVYYAFLVKGVTFLGLSIMVLKLLTNANIDYLMHAQSKAYEEKHKQVLPQRPPSLQRRRSSMVLM